MKNSSSNIIDYSCIDSSACCFLGLQCSIGSCRGLFGFSHTSSTDRVILNPEFDGTQWSEKLRRQLVMARVKCNFCVQLVILCRSSLLAQFPAVRMFLPSCMWACCFIAPYSLMWTWRSMSARRFFPLYFPHCYTTSTLLPGLVLRVQIVQYECNSFGILGCVDAMQSGPFALLM